MRGEAGAKELQARAALEGYNSISSAYGDVIEKSRDRVFTGQQGEKTTGKNLHRRDSAWIQAIFFFQEDSQAEAQVAQRHFEVSSPNRQNEAQRSLTSKLTLLWAGDWARDSLRSPTAFDFLLPPQSLAGRSQISHVIPKYSYYYGAIGIQLTDCPNACYFISLRATQSSVYFAMFPKKQA